MNILIITKTNIKNKNKQSQNEYIYIPDLREYADV